MYESPLTKIKSFPLLAIIAISLSLLLPIELKPCSIPSEKIGPVLKKGYIIGFKIYRMHKDHFLRYIGLERNDIITEVNEHRVSHLLQDESLFKKLKQGIKKSKHIKLNLVRKKTTYEIEFILNSANISKIESYNCGIAGFLIDQSIPKKEMFNFYEMKKIE